MGTVGGQRFSRLSQDVWFIEFNFKLWLHLSRTFRVMPKPLLRCLGRVLRVNVQFRGEPLDQSVVLRTLDYVFIMDISVFCCFQLSFYLDQFPSPCLWKTPPLLHCLEGIAQVTRGAWFPPHVMLRTEVHQTRESCFSVWESFRCFFLWHLLLSVSTEERLLFRNYRGHWAFGDFQYNRIFL